RTLVARLAAFDRWVIDGSYWPTLEERLGRADVAVFLDLPVRVYARRYLARRKQVGAARFMGALPWVLAYPFSERYRIRRRLSRAAHRVAAYHIRTVAEEEALVGALTRRA